MRAAVALGLMLVLSACGRVIPQGSVPPPVVTAPVAPAPIAPRPVAPAPVPVVPVAANALLAGVALGPAFAALPVADNDASGALAGFIESCPRLLAREDASGLTRPEDWRSACETARGWPRARARAPAL
jgi:membrane-bound lytic murein transglycosylase A